MDDAPANLNAAADDDVVGYLDSKIHVPLV